MSAVYGGVDFIGKSSDLTHSSQQDCNGYKEKLSLIWVTATESGKEYHCIAA